jgi:hypothetical protein
MWLGKRLPDQASLPEPFEVRGHVSVPFGRSRPPRHYGTWPQFSPRRPAEEFPPGDPNAGAPAEQRRPWERLSCVVIRMEAV